MAYQGKYDDAFSNFSTTLIESKRTEDKIGGIQGVIAIANIFYYKL